MQDTPNISIDGTSYLLVQPFLHIRLLCLAADAGYINTDYIKFKIKQNTMLERMYHLATVHSVTDRWTDDIIMPTHAAWLANKVYIYVKQRSITPSVYEPAWCGRQALSGLWMTRCTWDSCEDGRCCGTSDESVDHGGLCRPADTVYSDSEEYLHTVIINMSSSHTNTFEYFWIEPSAFTSLKGKRSRHLYTVTYRKTRTEAVYNAK